MVTWGFAYRKGLVIFFWTIVWGIVGAIISLLISGGALYSVLTNPSPSAASVSAAFAALFIGFIIGGLVSSIGIYASIVKVTVEGAIQQMSYQRLPIPTSSTVPSSTSAMSIHCPNCRAIVHAGSEKCPSCGANLQM